MNMAATLFRLTVDGVPGRRHPRGRACAGPAGRGRHPRGRQALRPGDLEHRAAGGARLSDGLQSACMPGSGGGAMSAVDPAARATSAWPSGARSIAARPCGWTPLRRPRIAASAAAVERILARGEPVYGINTGFGKLASVRIEAGDLATAAAQHRALARRRRRRAHAGASRPADDGAEARQPGPGRLGRAARDDRPAGGDAGAKV